VLGIQSIAWFEDPALRSSPVRRSLDPWVSWALVDGLWFPFDHGVLIVTNDNASQLDKSGSRLEEWTSPE
jgi:hypothetical protein